MWIQSIWKVFMGTYNAWDTSDPALKKMNWMVRKSVLDITCTDCKDFYIKTRMRFCTQRETWVNGI